MDILDSLEVRWFLPADDAADDARAALVKWFKAIQGEGQRTDHYLLMGREDVTMKARLAAGKPAKAEFKHLVGSLGVVELKAGWCGELQRWRKLSLPLEDPEMYKDGTWLAVHKQRQLRKFEVTIDGSPAVREVRSSEMAATGCGVELTRLSHQRHGQTVEEWTFGLEAFGTPTRLLDVMRATVEALMRQSGLPELPARWTASYGTWLADRHSTGSAGDT